MIVINNIHHKNVDTWRSNQRFLLVNLKSSPPKFYSRQHDLHWSTVMDCLCHRWRWSCSVWRSQILFHLRSWLVSGFLTWVRGRVPLVNRKLFILLVYPSSPPFQSLVFWALFCGQSFVFSFVHCSQLFLQSTFVSHIFF